ncbi:hypothetical protein [Hymenobacter sp. BRD67]|uniref:hypothetical protein n=1 Tax=Hymenobacter sp. BRD67 TaxID=2675877 RepID=UPI0015674433|nr:hypothetical protein [Hymenobacter sp. BRD67]QKG54161.1 hypothetical protein GKZ67_18125 [Hymenobacter sp. BRD67]
MLRRFLLPLLGFAFLATEAASAQTQPTASPAPKPTASLYAHPAARSRVLTAREQRAAEAAAKAAALAAPAPVLADPIATASADASGWSNEPLPQATSQAQDIGNGQHRPTMNLSVAPGMPINQVTHGVSTDYDGHPIYRAPANTTLPTGR